MATKSKAGAAMTRYEACDRIADEAGDANVLLKLTGYLNTSDKSDLEFFYYRAGYSLYPRRLYVAPSDTIINNGWDILRVRFDPDPQWLRKRNVRLVLTISKDNTGRMKVDSGVPGTMSDQIRGNR